MGVKYGGRTSNYMNIYGLELPYAMAGHLPITPDKALPNTLYTCPECAVNVFLRAGEVKARHFAHVTSDRPCTISQETHEHMTAKHIIYAALSGEGYPIKVIFNRDCQQCGEYHYSVYSLDTIFGRPSIEHTIRTADGSWIRADIATLNEEGNIRVVIEVVATHAVDQAKAEKLGDITWFEVRASDVLVAAENRQWARVDVLTSGNIKPFPKCPTDRENVPEIDIDSQDFEGMRETLLNKHRRNFPYKGRSDIYLLKGRRVYKGNWKTMSDATSPPSDAVISEEAKVCPDRKYGHTWRQQYIVLNRNHPQYIKGIAMCCYRYTCTVCHLTLTDVWYTDAKEIDGNYPSSYFSQNSRF